jgi:hypothetical protein
MGSSQTSRRRLAAVATSQSGSTKANVVNWLPGFLYLQLVDDSMTTPIGSAVYEVRALKSGLSRKGRTDEDGILRQHQLPDDHYEVTCEGVTERVSLFYEIERDLHEGEPWVLRLRGCKK